MSFATTEILEPAGPRRRFSVAEKLSIVAETRQPGTRFVDVCRRYRLRAGQLYKWRRLVELGVIGIPGTSELPSFVAVEVREASSGAGEAPRDAVGPISPLLCQRWNVGMIEIDIGDGRFVRVDAHVNADALARVLSVLDRR
jgi:transposase